MLWRVSLVSCDDGSAADGRFLSGVIVGDDRSDAHDLILKANEAWKTAPFEGEVYSIEPLGSSRTVRITEVYDDQHFSTEVL